MKAVTSRRQEYSQATRQALLAAARRLFTAHGYGGTAMEAVVAAARVTRGALYHHFADKRALFDAVVVSLQIEAARHVRDQAVVEPDRWKRLRLGIGAYLDACLEPSYQRLVLQEAPAVLGMARFREIDEAYPLEQMTGALMALKKRGEIAFDDIDLLSRMVSAMLWELALLLPNAQDARKRRERGWRIVETLLTGLRPK
jgi:AcrR family transcriptional regulator